MFCFLQVCVAGGGKAILSRYPLMYRTVHLPPPTENHLPQMAKISRLGSAATHGILITRSLEKWLVAGMRQELYKMSLIKLGLLESEEAISDSQSSVKNTRNQLRKALLANEGPV